MIDYTVFLIARTNPVMGMLVFIGVVVSIAVAIWIFRDAEQRGKSGCLGALLIVFAGPAIGLIVWLLFRPPLLRPKKSRYRALRQRPGSRPVQRRTHQLVPAADDEKESEDGPESGEVTPPPLPSDWEDEEPPADAEDESPAPAEDDGEPKSD